MDRNRKIQQVRQLVPVLKELAYDELAFQSLTRDEDRRLHLLTQSPLSAGYFYGLSLLEHVALLFELAEKTDVVSELELETGNLIDFVATHAEQPPDWMFGETDELVEIRKAAFFVSVYTLNKNIYAIKSVGLTIGQLLKQGIEENDQHSLNLAIKLDPAAITSPKFSSLLMYQELRGKVSLRRRLANALKKPYTRKQAAYGYRRYAVYTLKEEGVYKSMSDEERYELLVTQLGLYPDTGNDPFGSFCRMLRRWE